MADIHPHAVRGSFVRVSSDAIRNNAASLVALAGDAALMAVVKADGYGHGAVTAATAAIEGGASWLGVALVSEGVMLRHAGIEVPILVLSEPAEAAMRLAAAHDLDVTVASPAGVSAAISAGDAHHATLGPLRVNLKVDTGMSRMGCSPSSAVELARALRAARGVDHIGLFTHLACADSDDVTSAERQLSRFESLLAELRALDLVPSVVHASNSAGTLFFPQARYDLVRCGIALYGLDPNPHRSDRAFEACALTPALSLTSYVSAVRSIRAGEGVSYGHRFVADSEMRVATVPLGYADGVPRALGVRGGSVLICGGHRPMLGVVTMDQLMVDISDGPDVRVGDEVVLIGSQGAHRIGADDWAERMETINYEIVCGLSARVARISQSSEST